MKQLPKVGDKVVLGRHVGPNGSTHNWDPRMDAFVGKTTTVIQIKHSGGIQETFGDYVYVDLDNGTWAWEVFYLQPAHTRSSSDDGCRCSKCREWVPYVEPSDTFVCYSCKRRP